MIIVRILLNCRRMENANVQMDKFLLMGVVNILVFLDAVLLFKMDAMNVFFPPKLTYYKINVYVNQYGKNQMNKATVHSAII